uniref:Chromosome (Plasmid) partitioning protein ParB n=1 Tax=Klebsiella pneumoniae TaxID=573 RepID=A0A8B0SU47_KLEPN|nr:Chromosome (plasmid) partitioning protein ParB [Klebsiella pneumoniae]
MPCLHIPENCLPGQVKPFRRLFADKEELLKQQAETLHDQKKAGLIFEAEEVISLFNIRTETISRIKS